jgi:indolepyruvate ferredoxin oxidoreductase beta subunit
MSRDQNKATNIVICGVGGQGIILASNVLCSAAFNQGLDVKKSEVHGMAQRGGSVITHVRFGPKIYSPLIEEGTANYILAFEKLEALRYLHFLKKNGKIILNDRQIPPMSVLTGQTKYPEDILPKLQDYGRVYLIDAGKKANELGNERIVNIILLGVLARYLNFDMNTWEKALEENIKEKYLELNVVAFKAGLKLKAK